MLSTCWVHTILTRVPALVTRWPGMADPVGGHCRSAAKSVRPVPPSEAYVEAMKEDLAEWLNALWPPGSAQRWRWLPRRGLTRAPPCASMPTPSPTPPRAMAAASSGRGGLPVYSVVPGSFMARDNVGHLHWLVPRSWVYPGAHVQTEDLVLRKNEKSVVLCLLEVARRGARRPAGPRPCSSNRRLSALRAAPSASNTPSAGEDTTETPAASGAPARGPHDASDPRNSMSWVREILGRCTCPDQFPMIKVSEGKYRVGDSSLLIFVRVLRSHVMVRVEAAGTL